MIILTIKKIRIGLVMLLCGMAWQAHADSNAVTQVEFAPQGANSMVVKVTLSQPLSASPTSFTVNNPPRVALDLRGVTNGLGKNTVQVNQGDLQSVNVVQAGDRTRVVLNLEHPAQYSSQISGNTLLITLHQEAVASTTNPAAQFAPVVSHAGVHTIRGIDFRRGKDGSARILADLSDTTTGIDIQRVNNDLQVKFIKTSIPNNLRRRLDVSDFNTPVSTVTTVNQGQDVMMSIHPKGEFEYSAYQMNEQFIVDVRKKSDANQVTGVKGAYVGEKLSLNFQNQDIRSILQVIADFTGKNIITSDSVKGNLTLRLKDVPWDQALDIILESKDLGERQNGDVIWVAPQAELQAKEKSELEAQQGIDALEPLVMRQYQLNYKKADSAARELLGQAATAAETGSGVTCSAAAAGITAAPATSTASAGTSAGAGAGDNPNRILSSRGTATSELQTNTLIVNDTASKQEQIAELLKLIDTPARQVMIEARVVVANDTFSKALGAKLGVNASNGTSATYGNANNTNILPMQSPNAVNLSNTAGTAGYAVNLPAPALAGNAAALGFSLFNVGSGSLLNLELQAMETDGVGKIISSPRVMTTNQVPAVILQGTQIPNVTPGTGLAPATVTFSDAFLCLLVNPQILNNDSVILTIEVQDDVAGAPFNSGGVLATPIDTKRVKTRVRMKDGQTIVLGGIFTQDKNTTQDKVPFFGDIPFLGALFRDNLVNNNKTELMVFITPHIMHDDASLQ